MKDSDLIELKERIIIERNAAIDILVYIYVFHDCCPDKIRDLIEELKYAKKMDESKKFR